MKQEIGLCEPGRRAVLGSAVLAACAVTAGSAAAAQERVHVIAELNAKPGAADALRALLEPFAASARHEPGCLQYELMEVGSEPGRFMTYEVWTDKAAIDAHMSTPRMKAAGPKAGPLLAKPPTQIFLNRLV